MYSSYLHGCQYIPYKETSEEDEPCFERYGEGGVTKTSQYKFHLSYLRYEWVSPIVVFLKKFIGKWRICVDFRELNKATLKDYSPFPFIDQVLDIMVGKQYFSFIDGYSGYNQILIVPEDQDKTTFTCPWGTYSYRVFPFGLCNAPATF